MTCNCDERDKYIRDGVAHLQRTIAMVHAYWKWVEREQAAGRRVNRLQKIRVLANMNKLETAMQAAISAMADKDN